MSTIIFHASLASLLPDFSARHVSAFCILTSIGESLTATAFTHDPARFFIVVIHEQDIVRRLETISFFSVHVQRTTLFALNMIPGSFC